MQRFDGHVAVVTGASRGIGLATAQRLIDEGASVVITGRRQEGLDAALAQLGTDAATAVAGRADDPEHRAAVLAHALDRHGRLDHLVNNAGINPLFGPMMEADPAAVRKMIDVNVLAAFEWTRDAVMAGLTDSVVNVSSVAGLSASPMIAFYGVTKAALISVTQQSAYELAPRIRVNAVAPAVVKTAFARALYEGHEAAAASAYPLGRLGEPDDVAAAVAFLLSSDASWMTGQTLQLDGGAGIRSAL
ncbi:SDR family oxidoreductase [Humibacter sp. RRB41]|uniref:SDR family oxidoreductase n=1 Tax=Humibacter sp. RRB41 TaxID=2919946 RepID=UPI001FAAE592|nr:SDR family oxidoreductase [Humibacter sp. RRB41]